MNENDFKLEIELIKRDIKTINYKIVSMDKSISGWKTIAIIVLCASIFTTFFNYFIFSAYVNLIG
jgi:hypothetical protein